MSLNIFFIEIPKGIKSLKRRFFIIELLIFIKSYFKINYGQIKENSHIRRKGFA